MTGMTVLYIYIYAQPQDCMMMHSLETEVILGVAKFSVWKESSERSSGM
jgi:hypothetical protein